MGSERKNSKQEKAAKKDEDRPCPFCCLCGLPQGCLFDGHNNRTHVPSCVLCNYHNCSGRNYNQCGGRNYNYSWIYHSRIYNSWIYCWIYNSWIHRWIYNHRIHRYLYPYYYPNHNPDYNPNYNPDYHPYNHPYYHPYYHPNYYPYHYPSWSKGKGRYYNYICRGRNHYYR